jgi:hypothetical protein
MKHLKDLGVRQKMIMIIMPTEKESDQYNDSLTIITLSKDQKCFQMKISPPRQDPE